MNMLLKKILEAILRLMSKAVLNKYNPEVVAITGSVGKTSTKEAVYTVLSATYNVRRNIKNYNNEIGIPLTIIGSESGDRNIIKWILIFFKALRLILIKDKKYPNILVLEMGADRKGDIKYLCSFVPVKVGVVTSVSTVHLEFFETLDQVAKEKGALVRCLSKGGYAVLNMDDHRVLGMKERTQGSIITYGFTESADISASQVRISHEADYEDVTTIQGISFKLQYQGKNIPVLLPNVIGRHLIYSALAAIAVGIIFDLDLHTIVESLKTFQPPKGRMNLIKGIKHTLIIDDTYNSSPLAVEKALLQLGEIKIPKHNKKFAVLGDMLELGAQTEPAHLKVGNLVFKNGIDYLVTVGEMSKDTAKRALKAGLSEDRIFSFANSEEAGRFVQEKMNEGDLVLVKGSQGMRMEKIVKEIMAEPLRAGELLVRQDKSWKDR